ncbi:MAG: hypothetical protein CM1200mP12_06880 [Gammaproteobacteria bacterium]|nr:MAG: hypothetical protein CM1200mP12_06880 [Gammaproteobacteria bacterium]
MRMDSKYALQHFQYRKILEIIRVDQKSYEKTQRRDEGNMKRIQSGEFAKQFMSD